MDKSELIDQIRHLNATASFDFLNQFNEYELEEYLDHLHELDHGELTAAAAAPAVPFH